MDYTVIRQLTETLVGKKNPPKLQHKTSKNICSSGDDSCSCWADRAASLQGTAGHLHLFSVKDTGEGTPIGMCLWDLGGASSVAWHSGLQE